jgi:hypothetical protein
VSEGIHDELRRFDHNSKSSCIIETDLSHIQITFCSLWLNLSFKCIEFLRPFFSRQEFAHSSSLICFNIKVWSLLGKATEDRQLQNVLLLLHKWRISIRIRSAADDAVAALAHLSFSSCLQRYLLSLFALIVFLNVSFTHHLQVISINVMIPFDRTVGT